MGGYDVRVYTSLYRNEIVGMVLVDALIPIRESFSPELKNMEGSWNREAQFMRLPCRSEFRACWASAKTMP
jgi:hypothetical protein